MYASFVESYDSDPLDQSRKYIIVRLVRLIPYEINNILQCYFGMETVQGDFIHWKIYYNANHEVDRECYYRFVSAGYHNSKDFKPPPF